MSIWCAKCLFKSVPMKFLICSVSQGFPKVHFQALKESMQLHNYLTPARFTAFSELRSEDFLSDEISSMLPLKRALAITTVLNVNKKYAFCNVRAANEIMYLFIRTLCLINEISYVILVLVQIHHFKRLLKFSDFIKKKAQKTNATVVELFKFNVA